jgi:hypothetical protein
MPRKKQKRGPKFKAVTRGSWLTLAVYKWQANRVAEAADAAKISKGEWIRRLILRELQIPDTEHAPTPTGGPHAS